MGIQQANFGDSGGFNWAPRRVGAVSLPASGGKKKPGWIRSTPIDETKGEGMEFEGEFEVPEGALSVRGCSVAVEVSHYVVRSGCGADGGSGLHMPMCRGRGLRGR